MQSGLFAGIVWERMVHQLNPILNKDKISIINVGLKRFEEDMEAQAATVCQVDWKPVVAVIRKFLLRWMRSNRYVTKLRRRMRR